ncbi:MAG: hypothetical protein ABUT20_33245 [Bacteroidota bacterium]
MEPEKNTEEKIAALHQKARMLLLNNADDEQIISELMMESID